MKARHTAFTDILRGGKVAGYRCDKFFCIKRHSRYRSTYTDYCGKCIYNQSINGGDYNAIIFQHHRVPAPLTEESAKERR